MISIIFNGYSLVFDTSGELFSPSKVDTGTLAMLSKVEFDSKDKILDLGCGYGVVGIIASKIIGSNQVVMSDISDTAIYWARHNAVKNHVDNIRIIQSKGYDNILDKDFSIILSNPPYHTDFSIAKEFIEEGFKRLVLNGKMIMVTKRKEWYKNKLLSIFGGVTIYEVNGYYVFIAEKRNYNNESNKVKNKNNMSKKLKRKCTGKV